MTTNQNLKIKSITINQDRINQIVSKANPMEIAQLAHFAEKAPHLIQIEYEKPKSNVLFAVEALNFAQKYWFIDSQGIVKIDDWRDADIDLNRLYLNNVFLTKENAQKQADRNQLLAEIERFAAVNNDVIDWSDETDKYYLYYSHRRSLLGKKRWYVGRDSFCQRLNKTYFSSETIATQALEKFKDRLDILLD